MHATNVLYGQATRVVYGHVVLSLRVRCQLSLYDDWRDSLRFDLMCVCDVL